MFRHPLLVPHFDEENIREGDVHTGQSLTHSLVMLLDNHSPISAIKTDGGMTTDTFSRAEVHISTGHQGLATGATAGILGSQTTPVGGTRNDWSLAGAHCCICPSSASERFGNLSMSNAIRANGYPEGIQTRQILALRKPEYSTPVLTNHEDSAMSLLYEKFRETAFETIGSGAPAGSVIGFDDPVDVEVLFRGRLPGDDFNASTFTCELWRNIVGQQDIFVVLAMVGMTTRLVRVRDCPFTTRQIGFGLNMVSQWMLIPTAQTWYQLPAMARPFPSQKFVPHNSTIDFCVQYVPLQTIADLGY